jgi:hypothetical protein
MLGKRGTEVRIQTNGVTTVKSLIAEGAFTVSGNQTNNSNFTLKQPGSWTNIFGTAVPPVGLEGYNAGVLSVESGDEFFGGPIYTIDFSSRSFAFNVPPSGSGAGLTNIPASAITIATNAWAVNTALGLGTNYYFSGNTASCGITGIVGIPAATASYAELTIKATGDITFTNPVAIYTSDMVDTRTITNGNTACVAVSVQPGFFTNLAIVQFK